MKTFFLISFFLLSWLLLCIWCKDEGERVQPVVDTWCEGQEPIYGDDC